MEDKIETERLIKPMEESKDFYRKWTFKLKDGGEIQAYFKDSEIEDIKKKHPEIKFTYLRD